MQIVFGQSIIILAAVRLPLYDLGILLLLLLFFSNQSIRPMDEPCDHTECYAIHLSIV